MICNVITLLSANFPDSDIMHIYQQPHVTPCILLGMPWYAFNELQFDRQYKSCALVILGTLHAACLFVHSCFLRSFLAWRLHACPFRQQNTNINLSDKSENWPTSIVGLSDAIYHSLTALLLDYSMHYYSIITRLLRQYRGGLFNASGCDK